MPLYEYQCEACGNRFERIQKFSDPPLDTCPSCGGAVRKLVSSPAFQFKGSGWYVTDYARAGKAEGSGGDDKKAEKPDAKPSSDKPAKTESSKDTKGADSSDSKPASSKPDKAP